MMPKIRKKPISSFVRNIMIMLRGSILAQIFGVLGGLYLAKIFGPDNYGIYGSIISLSSIIGLALTLQLDKAIVLSKDENAKNNWIRFLIPWVIMITGVLATLFYQFKISIGSYSHQLISISFLLSGTLALIWVYEAFLTSQKKFKTLSNTKIFLTLSIILFQYIFFKLRISNGLVVGFLIAQCIILFYFCIINRRTFGKLDFKELKIGFQNHKDILYFLLPSNVINGLGIHIMPILILGYFDPKVAAVYFLSVKLLSMPLHLMTSSIGNVFFEKASRENQEKNIFETTKKIVITNVVIMLFFLLFLHTIGVYALEYVFDKEWKNLSLYLQILSFLFLARVSFNPISSLIVVLQKNHIGLIFNIYLVLVNVVAIYFGYIQNNIVYTLYILSAFGGMGYLSLLFYFRNLLKNAE